MNDKPSRGRVHDGKRYPMGGCGRASAHLGEARLTGVELLDKWDACGWEGTFGERGLTGHRHGGRRAQNTSVHSHLLLEHKVRPSTSEGEGRVLVGVQQVCRGRQAGWGHHDALCLNGSCVLGTVQSVGMCLSF